MSAVRGTARGGYDRRRFHVACGASACRATHCLRSGRDSRVCTPRYVARFFAARRIRHAQDITVR